MNRLAAHRREYTRKQADLYLAFELGNKEWKLGFTVGFGQKPRERTVWAYPGLVDRLGLSFTSERSYLLS